MDSFLKDIAKQLLASGRDLKETVVVLPNRRAGLFFVQHLGAVIQEPTWMPEVKTIEQVFSGLAGQSASDDLSLIFELYEVYRQLQSSPEEFDRFYFWGELILKDFNDIDQFMADAKVLYRNLSEIKAIESDLSYLSPEQVQLISQFWKSFQSQQEKERERFLRFWQILGDLYEKFNAHLEVLGMAYTGKVYRQVASRLDRLSKPSKHYVFVGFNAFTLAEEALIRHYVGEFGAEIFWDLDAYYLEDKRQEAGLFFRDYQKDKVFGPTFPNELPSRIEHKSTKISSYAIPLKINQANLVGKLLEQVAPGESLEETVVILPDEQLLFPVLHALPESIGKLNVTMGYPIRNAPVYAFLDAVLDLQRFLRMREGLVYFYHKQVLDLLSFPYLLESNPDFVRQLKKDVSQNNTIEIGAQLLAQGGELFARVFQKVEAKDLFDYLGGLMEILAEQLKDDAIQRSYLFQAFKQLNRMREVFASQRLGELRTEFFLKIFRQLFREVRLPFEGEPLEGLQLMGVLESRNLDFKRVIICDVNEGSFPPGGGINSMIPFNLRRAFRLPVQEQNDAIYAYTFYRLLHRAEEVHLIYTTASDQGKAGEMSRFVQQMHAELGISKPKVLMVEASLTPSREITVEKTPPIMDVLSAYFVEGEVNPKQKRLSASAINAYLDCRLRFYFQYIAGLKENEEVSSEVDAGVFGNILHKAIELLYGEPVGIITPHVLERLKPQIPAAVDRAIADFYKEEDEKQVRLTGQMHIVREIFIHYIQAIVDYDQRHGDFKVLGLEAQHNATIKVDVAGASKDVGLSGFIDRMDEKDGVVRLLDYKTGKDDKKFNSVASLFDREASKRNKAAMQTLLYAYFYQFDHPSNTKPLKPGLFNVKEIYKDNFSPFLIKEKEQVENYLDIREEFEQGLSGLLSELFNADIPFDQTQDAKKCQYCSYREICGKG